ncbi:glycosyl transferase [Curtobacterium oceanosedimentum]|uniref:D-inositol 3-phosphate glycosyltransferase n=1 Tax=Curtobacterium oceanosedimentum TaxID=465820 RepID=A0A147DQK8_9MICO|nr:glycosyltransferase [Curtobacterium oceanosedimentum]KTR38319.1 glycosyl transferase [Curtobacterium oceanosedimentum]KTR51845.1 glycosyl transferase [Curtobacterium oceanosedimentum]
MNQNLIVHEWLETAGGAERVVDEMRSALPDARVLCLWSDRPADASVTETWLAKTPLRRSKSLAMPFMSATWRQVDLSEYDTVLISTHLFAHHVAYGSARRSARRTLSYVHTPARYLWAPHLDGRAGGALGRLVSPALRRLDRRMAGAATGLAANSEFVRRRIQAAWNRDAAVIHPPVRVSEIQRVLAWCERLDGVERQLLERLPDGFLLGASRFVPYKQLDRVIEAGEATDRPVVLAGAGPDLSRLRERASRSRVPVHFVARPSDAMLFALYERAAAFVFPAVEDFGIMPVEAMATGTPVIVGTTGGATESVVDGVSGVHVADWSETPLREAVDAAVALRGAGPRQVALRFDQSVFQRRIQDWVAS